MKTKKLSRGTKGTVLRPAGFADDYKRAQKAELLEDEEGAPDETSVRGGEKEALRVSWKKAGKATQVIRRPHASAMVGSQNELYLREIERIRTKQRGPEEPISDEDMQRLRYLNEMVSRNLRIEMDLLRFEGDAKDLSKEEMAARMRQELEKLEAELE